MRLKCCSLVVLALCAAPAFSEAGRADVTVTPIVTLREAQADFSAGKFPECIQKIDKMLEQKPRPTPAEKANLLNMKAECLLQEKQAPAAQDGFAAAGKAYAADRKAEDKTNAAVAFATAELIQKSEGLVYAPTTYLDKTGNRKLLSQKPTSDKSPAPAAIGILDSRGRPAAITALFEDEYTADEPAYKALSGKSALPPLVDFAPKLVELVNLELAATGADAKTKPMQKALADDTKKTLDTNLTAMQKRVDGIAASAATMVNVPGTGVTRGKRRVPVRQKERGLNENDRSTLQDFASELDKVPEAVKAIVPALAPGADHFKTELARAAGLKKKIEAVLAGRFK